MKTKITILLILSILNFNALSQNNNVGIGNTSPDPSAKLEVKSTTQGMLVPRMTSAERNAITNPAPGLLLYDTEVRTLFIFEGQKWVPLAFAFDNKDFPATERTIDTTTSLGYRVAISDIGIASSTDNGKVFFFKSDEGNYTEVEEVISSSSDPVAAKFGQDIALSDDYLIVGAPGGNSDSGRVYIFERVGDAWQEVQSIKNNTTLGSGIGDGFGWSVAISGNTILVGAPFADPIGSTEEGVICFFDLFSSLFVQTNTTIQPFGGGFAPNDNFGWDVDLDGVYALAGCPGHSNKEGKVYYYRNIGGTITLDFQETYSPLDRPNSYYGYSVGIDSTFAIIGIPGIGSVSTPNTGGFHIIGNFGGPEFGDDNVGKVALIHRALYGGKTAG
ncbi:MAG: FG-GAP repeat protein, partial [Bacteroidota bacterium]